MVQNLRARLLEGSHVRMAGRPQLDFLWPPQSEGGVLSPAQSMSLVEEFERQLGDIKESVASSGCLTALTPEGADTEGLLETSEGPEI